MAWLHATMASFIKSVLPTGPKINQEPKPLKTWTKANGFSSGWLSGVFCHCKRPWTYIVLKSNVAMWVSNSQGVLIFINNQTEFSISRSICSACLWRCFQKGLTKEKDPPWSRWDIIKRGKEKASNLLLDCRDNITKCLTFHPHNHSFPAMMDCIL